MEAMAAAEQAIELATATTSMATATKAAAAATTATAAPATATKPPTPVVPSQEAVSSHSMAGNQSSPHSTVKEPHHNDNMAQHAQHAQHVQHGHRDPLQEALQLQHHSQTLLEEEGQEDDSQPLIAGPKGLLQVSLDQRPAKQYFDRSALPVLPTNFLQLCACCAGFQAI